MDLFGAAQDLLGGFGSLFGGNAAAKGDRAAAAFYGKAAGLTQTASALKEVAVSRDIYKTLGGGIADTAASGLDQSGSAADILRASASQGALSKALVQIQGNIDVASLLAKQKEAEASASAHKSGGIGGLLGGLIGAAGALL